MKAALSIFEFAQGVSVRAVLRDEGPWFVIADLAEALGYRDAANAGRVLDDDEKGTQSVSTPSGRQKMLVCSESGLYALILRSRKTEAKRFRRWVTGEVLPSIRKTGRYEPEWRKLRHQAASSFKVANDMLQMVRAEAGKATERHHYSNEARLVNWALAGEFKGIDRDGLSASDLQLLAHLEERNAVLIGRGMAYEQRKPTLKTYAMDWRMEHTPALTAPVAEV